MVRGGQPFHLETSIGLGTFLVKSKGLLLFAIAQLFPL